CWHAFVWASMPDDIANQVAVYVMGHKLRTHQIRPTSTRSVRSMTESTSLLKLFVPALDLRGLGRWLLGFSSPEAHYQHHRHTKESAQRSFSCGSKVSRSHPLGPPSHWSSFLRSFHFTRMM